MSTTIKEIAQRSGMAVQTVSEILNGKGGRYRIKTQERVKQAAKDLHYRPNAAAKAMRSGKFYCAALLLSTEEGRSNLPQELLGGICDELAEHDYHLTVARLPDAHLENEELVPKILRQWLSDGLLVNYSAKIPPHLIEMVHRSSGPAVWINSRQKSDCVYPDNFAAAKTVTKYLLSLGHKKIAYVDYAGGNSAQTIHFSRPDRHAGYEQAMRDAALTPRFMGPDYPVHRRDRVNVSSQWLSEKDPPTAILAHTRTVAWPIIEAARNLNLRVPGDLSIASFADSERIDDTGTMLTTINIPNYEIGRVAVKTMLEKIEYPDRIIPPQAMEMSLMIGETTAPPDVKKMFDL